MIGLLHTKLRVEYISSSNVLRLIGICINGSAKLVVLLKTFNTCRLALTTLISNTVQERLRVCGGWHLIRTLYI